MENYLSLTTSFDIGHSSIGWSVLSGDGLETKVVGAGSVIIPSGMALANERAGNRRMRRHIKATRERITLLGKYFVHRSLIPASEAEKQAAAGHNQPWLLAARALRDYQTLTSQELWHVIRWYAHNRGYDGNAAWARAEGEDKEDTEKVENAKKLMQSFETASFAETVCAFLEIDITDPAKRSSRKYFKGESVAFPREVVIAEVRKILQKQRGIEPTIITALLDDKEADATFQHGLPPRWKGGFLFGQKIPRFDNRIIPVCPVTGHKKPLKHTPAFFRYRWMMLLRDLRVQEILTGEIRPLTADETARIDAWGQALGRFTKTSFKDLVETATHCNAPQLDQRFMTEEMTGALEVEPVKATILKAFKLGKKLPALEAIADLWRVIPAPLRHQLFRQADRQTGTISIAEIGQRAQAFGITADDFEKTIATSLETFHPRRTKSTPTCEEVLATRIHIKRESGRAPYAKSVLRKAVAQIGEGKDPRAVGHALHIPPERMEELAATPIDHLTNNHLVRHRLKVYQALLSDVRRNYEKEGTKIARVVVEVVRDLTEFSGLNAKEKESLLKSKTRHHKKISEWLENQLKELGKESQFSAGLIRKARIGDDQGWLCPFTGHALDLKMLLEGQLQLDHIIPYSQRPSNSLDSLVLTFREVNELKGNRTARTFIREAHNTEVTVLSGSNRRIVQIMTEDRYEKLVRKMRASLPTDDDKRRCKRRIELLLRADYDKREREFTAGDLTQTSHLNKLAAAVTHRAFQDREKADRPTLIHLPGGVTGAVRKSWKLLGTLATAVPTVLLNSDNPAQGTKSKGEVRDITHLHHALDAIIAGLAATRLPRDTTFYRVLLARRNKPEEIERWRRWVNVGKNHKAYLPDLSAHEKNAITAILAEKRVVYHQPRSMRGMKTEQTTWRVEGPMENGKISIHQRTEIDTTGKGQRKIGDPRRRWKHDAEWPNKLLGYHPPIVRGKLAAIKGAIVISDNFGLALDPEPSVIPFHQVYAHLKELTQANEGKRPRVIRNGSLIHLRSGKNPGIWRVLSVKNTEAFGLALDLIAPERIKIKGMKKADGFIGNAMITTLLRSGLEIVAFDYCGFRQDD